MEKNLKVKSSKLAEAGKAPRARKAGKKAGAPAGDLSARVAETAYYLAERRGFEPGHELEDWFEAEKIVANGATPREMASHA